jgi:predicted transcriptional regulator
LCCSEEDLTASEDIIATLRAAVERGIADANAGRVMPAEEVFSRLAAKYRAAAASGRDVARRNPVASND